MYKLDANKYANPTNQIKPLHQAAFFVHLLLTNYKSTPNKQSFGSHLDRELK
ncbi:hypothetical protein Mucpa_3389 [Mucilaginibacter paludis DSM 18603]|uniref:Uncharacterized protein n=1 Tax=Mucilaginibacter paludis DSM 18603 TaxID=714943 RepID=H1YHT8_9SPHI|nr:hypothetical protein Mucpa_3389 [Mucilaginibacter paludis DSM 18603]